MRRNYEHRIRRGRKGHLLLITSGARACGHSVVTRDAEILPLFVRRKNLQKVFLACVVGVTSKQERQQDPQHVAQIVGCALHFSVAESVA
jgi:hypothetical protein